MRRHFEIVEDIKKRIAAGEFKIGSEIPTQGEWASKFNTSRVTVSAAFKLLREQGVIETRRGEGSFVISDHFVRRQLEERFPLSKMFPEMAHSKVVSFDIRLCDELEQDKLGLNKGDKIYEIIRLRMIGEHPQELEYTIMPVLLIPGITQDILEGSIYEYIHNTLNLKIGRGRRIFRADTVDYYDMKYLHVIPKAAIFEIEQVAYLTDGRCFEYSHTRFSHHNIEVISEVRLGDD